LALPIDSRREFGDSLLGGCQLLPCCGEIAHVVSILSVLACSPTARARLGLAKVATGSKSEQLRPRSRPRASP
jgi:hypothetical protein